jgi:uncharacterized protein (TIGR02996 family)
MTNAERLHSAASRWQQGARAEALADLVTLWRQWPSLDLGDCIATLTKLASAGRAPIRPSSSKSAAQAWREVAALNDPLDLPRLLEPLPAATVGIQRERATTVAAWPSHPLVTGTILEWWKKPERHVDPMTPAFVENLRAAKDPRLNGVLGALMNNHLAATRRVGRAHAKLVLELASESSQWTPLVETADETEALEDLERLIRAGSAPETDGEDLPGLFAKVYAAPSDDSLRALLADALVAKGDARGEFISMQLLRGDAPASVAEKRLLAQWSDTWLGRLAPCFRRGVVFRRGFPVHGEYEKGGDRDWPEWATFESLECTPASGFIGGGMAILGSPHFRSLRSVIGLGSAIFETYDRMPDFGSLRTTPWHTVGFLADARLVPRVADLFTHERFPEVRRLVLGAPQWGGLDDGVVAQVVRLPWFSRITHLDVALQGDPGWAAALSRPVESLTLRNAHDTARATLEAGALALTLQSAVQRGAEFLVAVLQRLPPSTFGRVTLSLPRAKRQGTVLAASQWKKVDVGPLLARLKQLPVPVELPW